MGADLSQETIDQNGAQQQNSGHNNHEGHGSFLTLALGSIGVVFGDIGTSPFYAMRESIHHASHGLGLEDSVIGIVSLILWALMLIVTLKYVVFLMRADNKGEGGTLALMALAQKAFGGNSKWVFFGGVIGAAFFYGDGIITPAISVLGAIEGLKVAPGLGESFSPYIVPISVVILVGLFLVQSKGTHTIAAWFGPITAIWFLTLAALGIMHIMDDPQMRIIKALNPYFAIKFLIQNGFIAFLVLGSVFLAVTGAEALYADMGHFGKRPIQFAWGAFVLPCLVLNYLGQGAFVIAHPEAKVDPFWMMVPDFAFWPVMILAALAAIIASQAVITGAFSLTQQAVQLGLLPRMIIKRTSETQAGQIFVPQVNSLLLIGVLLLVAAFQTSSALTSAYGIAITGAMLMDTLLAAPVVIKIWNWKAWQAALLLMPILVMDIIFVGSQLPKIPHGAWMPLVLGAAIVLIMWTWVTGSKILSEKTRRDSIPLKTLLDNLSLHPVHKVSGTAIFLTSDPDLAPMALMHNLKHNKVLHETIAVLSVVTAENPRVLEENRLEISDISPNVKRVMVRYGFMESPNIPKALTLCRKQGLKFDIMSTSFFLGHRTIVASAHSGMPLWQDKLFIFLSRNATNATDFFHIPSGRVVELGTQVVV
ncbi:MAG: potassium transporter Kup [Caulobacterales bacterium]|nr:potassium transporter Kup [Caulobacterales bacterium]